MSDTFLRKLYLYRILILIVWICFMTFSNCFKLVFPYLMLDYLKYRVSPTISHENILTNYMDSEMLYL